MAQQEQSKASREEIDELVEILHQLSMSKDATKAMRGRALKATAPGLVEWLEDEIARGSSPPDVAFESLLLISRLYITVMLRMPLNDEADRKRVIIEGAERLADLVEFDLESLERIFPDLLHAMKSEAANV